MKTWKVNLPQGRLHESFCGIGGSCMKILQDPL